MGNEQAKLEFDENKDDRFYYGSKKYHYIQSVAANAMNDAKNAFANYSHEGDVQINSYLRGTLTQAKQKCL